MLNVHQNLITYAWNRLANENTEHFVYLSHPDLEAFLRDYCVATAQALTGLRQVQNTAKFANDAAITVRPVMNMNTNQFRGRVIRSLLLDSDMFSVESDWNVNARKVLVEAMPSLHKGGTEFFILMNDSGTIVNMSYDSLLKKLGVNK